MEVEKGKIFYLFAIEIFKWRASVATMRKHPEINSNLARPSHNL